MLKNKILIITIVLVLGLVFMSGCLDSDKIIDCGKAEAVNECFLNAAKDCTPAKIFNEMELNMFGMIIHTEGNSEIKGMENGKCVFYKIMTDYSITISDETKQQMLDSGMTEEEIELELEKMNQQNSQYIGKESTCFYPISDLVEKLEQEKEGIFSATSYDEVKYQCVGSLYDMANSKTEEPTYHVDKR